VNTYKPQVQREGYALSKIETVSLVLFSSMQQKAIVIKNRVHIIITGGH